MFCFEKLLFQLVGILVDKLFMNTNGACVVNYIMESLILAQNERWRRVLSMQVER